MTTPDSLNLARKTSHEAVIRKDGFREERVAIQCDLNLWAWGNLLLGGIPGFLIDAGDGAMGELKPSEVRLILKESSP